MDEQFVNDFVAASLNARSKELRQECDELETRINELETGYQRKSDEVNRLRQSIKREQSLKQSALAKLAQIDCGGSTGGTISCTSQWSSAAGSTETDAIGSKSTESGSGQTTRTDPVDSNLQRRMLEVELQLVSKERENLAKHKAIIDQFEKLLEDKRQQTARKDEEIGRMRLELNQKQVAIDQFRREHGLVLKTSPSATAATTPLERE